MLFEKVSRIDSAIPRFGDARGVAQKCSSEKNTDSNKKSVYSDPLLARISISRNCRASRTPISSFIPSTSRKSRILSYPDFLSKEITAVIQYISSRRYMFANNTMQKEIKIG